jgi:hypothetical protein
MKKAFFLTTNQIIVLVLALISLALLLQIPQKIFSQELDEEVINTICWESIYQNAVRRVPGIQSATVKQKCPTKYVTFHETYAEHEFEANPQDYRSGKPVVLPDIPYKKATKACEDVEDEEACMFENINHIVAHEIAQCWRNMLRGEQRVFSTYTTDKQCIVCSVLLFDNQLRIKYGNNGLIGFWNPDYSLNDFMQKNGEVDLTGEQSYYEYSLDLIRKTWEPTPYEIDMNYEYAVVFTALNEHGAKAFFGNIWDSIKKYFTGYEAEEEGNYINTLNFIQNQYISQVCDTWA